MTLTHVVVLHTIFANPRSVCGCQKKMHFCRRTANSSVLSESTLNSGISMRNSSQHWQVVQQRCRITSTIFAPLEKKTQKLLALPSRRTVSCVFCCCCCCLSFQPFYLHIVPLFPLAWCHCVRRSNC